jgi:hypothetical protein
MKKIQNAPEETITIAGWYVAKTNGMIGRYFDSAPQAFTLTIKRDRALQ